MIRTMRWVALLRGVNVGGVKVTSAALHEVCADLGLERVRTVRASGNVVVDLPGGEPADGAGAADTGAALKARLEAALRERFGYEAFVVVLEVEVLRAVCAAYPFERDDEHHPYVVFSSDREVLARVASLAQEHADATPDAAVERLHLAGDVLHWRCPKGSSTDTPFARLLGAARWKPYLTTRNLRTLGEVLRAAEG